MNMHDHMNSTFKLALNAIKSSTLLQIQAIVTLSFVSGHCWQVTWAHLTYKKATQKS